MPDTSTPVATLRVLTPDDLDAATATLTRGFAQEPGNQTLYPDPNIRRRVSELIIGKELRAALPYASVHGISIGDRLVAAAIWHPPHVEARSLRANVRTGRDLLVQAPVLARGLPRLASVTLHHVRGGIRLTRARREAIAAAGRGASWHLAFLATDPDHRGRGLARRLLDHVLGRCDADGLPAWLETTDPVNPPLYERFGFETVTHLEDAAWLPGYWAMRREPQQG